MALANTLQDMRAFAREDYSFYLEYVHRGLYVPAAHHILIAEKLQRIIDGDLKRLMIFMPARHGKSMTVTETFPSYFLGRNPKKRVITVSYSDSLARLFGRKNRSKIEEYGSELFGVQLAADNASVQDWATDKGGGMLSVGIGAGITGRGADLLLLDDVIKNREEANSQVMRDKIYDEYQSTLLTRLQKGGAIVLIMTRWHEDDLAGRILAKEGDLWEVLSLPAEAEENDPLGRPVGAPLWAAGGYDEAWLAQIKRVLGSQAFNSIYQQRPSSAEGNIVKREWIKYYRQLPPAFDEMLISVDASFKNTASADYCVLQVWGKKGAAKYLVDQIRDRMNFPSTVSALRSLVAKYPRATAKLIEDKANGSAIIDFLKQEISGIIPVTPKESKEARLAAVSPEFESGSVFFPDPTIAHWIGDCVEELLAFPLGKNDDFVDATSQGLQRWQQPHTIWIGRA